MPVPYNRCVYDVKSLSTLQWHCCMTASRKGYRHNMKKSVICRCRFILLSILYINVHLFHWLAQMNDVLLQTVFRHYNERKNYKTLALYATVVDSSVLVFHCCARRDHWSSKSHDKNTSNNTTKTKQNRFLWPLSPPRTPALHRSFGIGGTFGPCRVLARPSPPPSWGTGPPTTRERLKNSAGRLPRCSYLQSTNVHAINSLDGSLPNSGVLVISAA